VDGNASARGIYIVHNPPEEEEEEEEEEEKEEEEEEKKLLKQDPNEEKPTTSCQDQCCLPRVKDGALTQMVMEDLTQMVMEARDVWATSGTQETKKDVDKKEETNNTDK
jgi:hypothetical protein